MKIIYCVTLSLLLSCLSGCIFGKPEVVDPCKNAPEICWGPAGVSPADVPMCSELIKCYEWQLTIK